MSQSELEVNSCSRRQARENACEQVTCGFGFTSDWSRKWREISFTNHKANAGINTQLKTALKEGIKSVVPVLTVNRLRAVHAPRGFATRARVLAQSTKRKIRDGSPSIPLTLH